MKFVSPRLAATSVVLAAMAVPVAAAIGAGPGMHSMVLLAAAWLAILGWSFRILLGRHQGFEDKLASAQALLELERKARTQAEQARGDTHTSLCRLIGQQEQVREEERNRIARDIHDDLGQRLLVLKIELDLMKLSGSDAEAPRQQHVDGLLQHLDQAIGSLRTVINDLRPLALEHGLRSAIEAHLAEFSRVSGIRHEFDADPRAFEAKYDPSLSATLFRILQESLANVARHAQASEVKIALLQRDDQLFMEVRDNGIGINMAGRSGTRGCGLLGIADRVSAAGGKFVVDSQPGAGTTLSLSIPLPRAIATA
jgi:signal transduction histidine kinase